MKATNHKQKGPTIPEMDWVLLSAEGMILPVPTERKAGKRKAGGYSKNSKTKRHERD